MFAAPAIIAIDRLMPVKALPDLGWPNLFLPDQVLVTGQADPTENDIYTEMVTTTLRKYAPTLLNNIQRNNAL